LGGLGGGGDLCIVSIVSRQLPTATVVARFVGATSGSADIRALLQGICQQISVAYGKDAAAVPREYAQPFVSPCATHLTSRLRAETV